MACGVNSCIIGCAARFAQLMFITPITACVARRPLLVGQLSTGMDLVLRDRWARKAVSSCTFRDSWVSACTHFMCTLALMSAWHYFDALPPTVLTALMFHRPTCPELQKPTNPIPARRLRRAFALLPSLAPRLPFVGPFLPAPPPLPVFVPVSASQV